MDDVSYSNILHDQCFSGHWDDRGVAFQTY